MAPGGLSCRNLLASSMSCVSALLRLTRALSKSLACIAGSLPDGDVASVVWSVCGTSVLVASLRSPRSLAIHHSSANLSKGGGQALERHCWNHCIVGQRAQNEMGSIGCTP